MSKISVSLLLIDDCDEDRMVYRRSLRGSPRYEYTIHEAATLEEGAAKFHEVKPDGVLLDYRLPDSEGMEFFERVQGSLEGTDFFVIMLTGQGSELIAAQVLNRGASDYLPKSHVSGDILNQCVHSAYDRMLLRRAVAEEQREKDRVIERLQFALTKIKQLSHLLPICAHCKNIRNDDGYWEAVESYFSDFAGAEFSHGICPDCMQKHFGLSEEEVSEFKTENPPTG